MLELLESESELLELEADSRCDGPATPSPDLLSSGTKTNKNIHKSLPYHFAPSRSFLCVTYMTKHNAIISQRLEVFGVKLSLREIGRIFPTKMRNYKL